MITELPPFASALGGVLMGLAAVLLMLFFGRVLRVTSILTDLLSFSTLDEWGWRAAIMAGMVSGPAACLAITGTMPVVDVLVSTLLFIFAADRAMAWMMRAGELPKDDDGNLMLMVPVTGI